MSPSIGPRTKRVTRRALLAQRDALSEAERAARSAQIAEAVDAVLDEYAEEDLGVIALYAAKGSEVDTAAIDAAVRARGLTVAYPRVIGDATALAFHAVRTDELVPSRFGLREPRLDAPAIDLARIGVFFIPGLAFDRAGGRIGWGRGHYDATLTASPKARRIGLAYDFQVVDEVAREAHDTLLHTIITEVTTYQVA